MRDLDLLIDAARTAGDIAKRYFNAAPEVWEKSGGQGPVTEADLHVNRQLEADLQAARPDYGWLSEETEDGKARQKTDRQFIVDPIDGTRAFIEGSRDWAHSLAVVENGRPVAAVVYLPIRDALYAAALGEGATLNGVTLTAQSDKPMSDATLLTTKPTVDPKHWRAGVPPFKRTFRSSLAFRLALVAEGRFDGMLTFRPTWEWDVAAGALIVDEAGGKATTKDGHAPQFNNDHPQINGMVAAGGIHDQIIAALA
ncbi:3'(2'),5'-bisphosphate nucleotidase CysQ [Pseudooctadecabacter jejudonensis]|uniref:Inositol-1-monophosphatase n=1 Tax=Pseudooctadecabacter jejudonensis TaxID=1391910 RepID=A0A1Y5SDD9_9RHOB|nr:3'(2'),5'-bisphosphate nucleotidase CysQ [Pseudooctadecabacter jejudonensis]SLN35087.1 Inositol-1-monophosphatase [Pseudooctadecabacter jejudonensis]